MSRRRARAFERCQIRQRVRLGTRNLPAYHQDRQPLPDPQRRENLLGIGARRIGDDSALEPASVGKVEQRKRAQNRLERAQIITVVRFLGVQGRGLLDGRQMCEVTTRNHVVGRAHDLRGVLGMIELNPVRRKHALERDKMLGVAINQRSIEIEQQRGFHLTRGLPCVRFGVPNILALSIRPRIGAPHIVAPICQGANSASPYPRSSDLVRSPEATARTLSKISCPLSAIETPSTMSPQLISMSSIIRRYVSLLVASLTDGVGLQP